MNRRKAINVITGIFAGGAAGLFTISKAFKDKNKPNSGPIKLDYNQSDTDWKYVPLDPVVTAKLAYMHYGEGGCMYATVKSIVSQLSEKIGGLYASFPFHMYRYGHGGVGGYGSICGTLNGAAAIIGLVVPDKSIKDKIIADIFQWYEKEPLPAFNPAEPEFGYTPVRSISNSVLCHVSNSNWCNKSGFSIGSKERKERCRRLTSDITKKTTIALNEFHADKYITNKHFDETVNSCVVCHGKEGKLKNVSVKMSCHPCHSESVGHRVFSDIHYKLMNEK